jgi:hypothetical protein
MVSIPEKKHDDLGTIRHGLNGECQTTASPETLSALCDNSGGSMRQIRWFISLIAISFLGVSAMAQTPTGTIQGVVTDKTGAVVQGASISIVKTTTNEERKATTDSAGRFEIVFVEPGIYNVSVEAQGLQVGEAGRTSW